MNTLRNTWFRIIFLILCLVLVPRWMAAQEGASIRKLSHDLDGWSVLDFKISADGRWIVYRTNDYGSGLGALYSVPANGSVAPVMLAAQTGGAALAFHEYAITPDSTRVVWRGDLQADGVIELFSRPINGLGNAVKISHDLGGWAVLEFQISNDGSRVVYRTNDYGSGLSGLYSVPTNGSVAPVTLALQTGGAALAFHEFAITPDSARVVWRGDLITDRVIELFSRPIDGSTSAVKLNHSLGGWAVLEFQISNDGSRVVYRTNDYGSGLSGLYSVPTNGSVAPVTLALQTGGAALAFHEFAISPDSARVVWRGDLLTDRVIELFSRPINGMGTAVKISHDLGGWAVLEFQISNDGSRVVYRTNDYGSGLSGLYSVPTNGSAAPVTLALQTGGAALAFHEFAISPDSARVVWRGDLLTDRVIELFSRPIDGSSGTVKLNHSLGGWAVLEFQISNDGSRVVYRTNDFGSGLGAFYDVPTSGSAAPATLAVQTGGAALAFHEYAMTPDSARVIWRGDRETDGVEELYAVDFPLFGDGFESGNLSVWSSSTP